MRGQRGRGHLRHFTVYKVVKSYDFSMTFLYKLVKTSEFLESLPLPYIQCLF